MTPIQVGALEEGDVVKLGRRVGRVTLTGERWHRVDWVNPKRPNCYDVLDRRSPTWELIETL